MKPKMKHNRQLWIRAALAPTCAILMFAIVFLLPIRASASPLLFVGDKGEAVALLQQSLSDLGYDPGPIDGDFGWRTDDAVRRFQEATGLYPDGICGPLTWTALERLAKDPSRGWTVQRSGALHGKTIALDPGHGGPEPGAISSWGDKEKYFTLDIARKTKEYLEAQGAKVILTRHGDYPPGSDWGWNVDELVARASLANSNGADLFVSVHINSYPKDPSVSGVMGFYRSDSLYSLALAKSLTLSLARFTGLRYIDIQPGPYYVLNHTSMPAALLEVGFMTNWHDVDLLRQDSFRSSVARGIVGGVIDYFAH